ncbi:alpha-ketoacid dehydrogenase subunit alpha/beta [Acidiluteibacter ferrifornacis]|uniref:Dehydrogenase n=1 Tax=Acidiluteibacter ferrifornacis TaxID=2692424 RepID=A0A6N9NI62_9FLAO|nr:dehydrogenase E1 component subunit alpha/beta [Acidiluteibacter ferrifornacis]NBG65519.1 dehydrogenase [Acidiluteibacter ferrifornacis]
MGLLFDHKDIPHSTLKELYKNLLKPRMIEEKMLLQLRQGKISKWFSGIGQEAISVGTTLALNPEEYILPMHRNLGVFTSRGIPLNRLFAQFQGKMSGFTKGRDRSFHFGTNDYKIVGMISHLGPQLGVADGIGLASLLDRKKEVTAVFTGDGGASQGDFHESLNVAAVWNLPVLFIVENNGYGLSTPSSEQFKCQQFIDKGIGYGMEAVKVEGNNILDVYSTIKSLAESMRENPRPILVECMTFRMRGHEEASGTKYVPNELFEEWETKNPVDRYREYLELIGVWDADQESLLRLEIKNEIEEGLTIAYAEDDIVANTETELSDMYAPFDFQETDPTGEVVEKRMIDAISDGLREAMIKHDDLVLMGQDIAEYGGVFKITDGFVAQFGKERVRNTPLCESAIVGTALGLSIKGKKAMMEMQFADFVTEGFNQIVNNLAKIHYRWGQNADVVVRMPTGAGVAAGPYHSQSNEAWFTHTPGLKVVYPAFPEDAKGLLLTAFEDPNPVLFFEHKALYRSLSGKVPEGYYTIPFGKARAVKEGTQVSIITYGMGVHWALAVLEKHPEISADLIDLRTLSPLDTETIYASVNKTGRAIVLQEDVISGGIASDISALIMENCFTQLDAPVKRCASLDSAIPFNPVLEKNFLASNQFEADLLDLIAY